MFQQPGQQLQQAAEPVVGVATGVTWWLFGTLAISLILVIWGGAIGVFDKKRRPEDGAAKLPVHL